MFSLITNTSGATILLASLASAQNFRIVAEIYSGTPGDTATYRTWYGDGNLYIGSHIPASLSNTLNFTIPDWLATQPQFLVGPVAPATTDDLPEGTFVAINNSTGATDRVLFTNDESSLGEGWISEWLRYGTFLIPKASGGPSLTQGSFYLDGTEEPDTFVVTWRTPGTPSEGLQPVNLTAIL